MRANFFDVRAFGAVMSTGGYLRPGEWSGAMTFATSVEPIVPVKISITRMAATNEAEKKQKEEGTTPTGAPTTARWDASTSCLYGLQVARGFISAKFAERTGFGPYPSTQLVFPAADDHAALSITA